MSESNKVVWSEGMFLQPHHLQQHDRYLEMLLESRTRDLRPYPWGLVKIAIDTQMLTLGKIALRECGGVLPDGTPFAVPEEADPPVPLEIAEDVKNTVVYLALPARRAGADETDSGEDPRSLVRFTQHEREVLDSNAGNDTATTLRTGRLRLRLVLEGTDVGAYTYVGVCRIIERRSDAQIVLDDTYIPPCLDYFLLGTSILERLCGPLCDALLPEAAVSGQDTLQSLERANLFIVPLDHERRWYRYHQLFAGLLQDRLARTQPDRFVEAPSSRQRLVRPQ